MQIGIRLKKLRKEEKITQKTLADYLEISERAYQHYESDTREPPLSNVIKLANYFNVSLDFLTERTRYLRKGEIHMDNVDIIEIFETTRITQVNEYLKLGWQLIETVKGIGSADMQMDSYILYCLGWNVSKGEVIHPISSDNKTKESVDDDDMPF